MDVITIKKMIIDLMRSQGLTLLQAHIKASNILDTAVDLIKEDYDNGDLK